MGRHVVRRVGFGAMQLPGPGVFGPPKDHDAALQVVRHAVELGVDHIDTAQFYGPDVANAILREALHPYPDGLVIVSKVGAARDDAGHWLPAQTPEQLRDGVEANLDALDLDQIPVVNLRRHPSPTCRSPSSSTPWRPCAGGPHRGHRPEQRRSGPVPCARSRVEVVCVQNPYNLVDTPDSDVFEACRDDGVAFVPFFPLGSAFHADNPVLADPIVVATARRWK